MTMDVAASSKGAELLLNVKPVCMGFEDYYAAFDKERHHSFSVSPVTGRMEELTMTCKPAGQAGEFVGNLVTICRRTTARSATRSRPRRSEGWTMVACRGGGQFLYGQSVEQAMR